MYDLTLLGDGYVCHNSRSHYTRQALAVNMEVVLCLKPLTRTNFSSSSQGASGNWFSITYLRRDIMGRVCKTGSSCVQNPLWESLKWQVQTAQGNWLVK